MIPHARTQTETCTRIHTHMHISQNMLQTDNLQKVFFALKFLHPFLH